jgi:hypothetical protein
MDGYLQVAESAGDGHPRAHEGDVVLVASGAANRVLLAGSATDGGCSVTVSASDVAVDGGPARFAQSVYVGGSEIAPLDSGGVRTGGITLRQGILQTDTLVVADDAFVRVKPTRTLGIVVYDEATASILMRDYADADWRPSPVDRMLVTHPTGDFTCGIASVEALDGVAILSGTVPAGALAAGMEIVVSVLKPIRGQTDGGGDAADDECDPCCADLGRASLVFGHVVGRDGRIHFVGPPAGVFPPDVSAVFDAVSCQAYRVVGPRTVEPFVFGQRPDVRMRSAPRIADITILDGAVDGVLPISGAETLVVAGAEARRFVHAPTTPDWKTLGGLVVDLHPDLTPGGVRTVGAPSNHWVGLSASLVYDLPYPASPKPHGIDVLVSVEFQFDDDDARVVLTGDLDELMDSVVASITIGNDGRALSVIDTEILDPGVTVRLTLTNDDLNWSDARFGRYLVHVVHVSYVQPPDSQLPSYEWRYDDVEPADLPRVIDWGRCDVQVAGDVISVTGGLGEAAAFDATESDGIAGILIGGRLSYAVVRTTRGATPGDALELELMEPNPDIDMGPLTSGSHDIRVTLAGRLYDVVVKNMHGDHTICRMTDVGGGDQPEDWVTHMYLGTVLYSIHARFHGSLGQTMVELARIGGAGPNVLPSHIGGTARLRGVAFRVPALADEVQAGGGP